MSICLGCVDAPSGSIGGPIRRENTLKMNTDADIHVHQLTLLLTYNGKGRRT